jgi:hypothetical protein
MPSPFGPSTPGSSGTYRSPSITVNQGGKVSTVNAGKVTVGVSDPVRTIAASADEMSRGAVGLGKGLVSIVENLPVVGAIAKPVIGGIGTIADATVGQLVSAAERTPIIGDIGKGFLEISGNVVTGALDLISAPARAVEERVAAAKIQNRLEGKTDIINTVFGEASAAAVNSVRGGASIQDAAEQLARSNAGFSDNGAMNFLWSLALDPLTYLAPGIGKAASIGAEAAQLSKIGVAGLRELSAKAAAKGLSEAALGYTKQAAFLEKWGLLGDIYTGTLGRVAGRTRNLTGNITKEVGTMYTRAYAAGLDAIDSSLNDITAIAGREVTNRGLKNVATTAANAVKSASVRSSAAIVRSNARDFADNLISDFAVGTTSKMDRSAILAQEMPSGGTVIDFLRKLRTSGITKEKDLAEALAQIDGAVNNAIDYIEGATARGIRMEEIRRNPVVENLRDMVESYSAKARIEQKKDLILETARYTANGATKFAAEDAYRLLSEAKLDRLPAANDPIRGIEELAADIASGFGIADDVARRKAEQIFADNAGNIRVLTDVLSFFRDAAYGQAVRELAAVRRLFGDGDFLSRITITSRRSLTKRKANELIAEVKRLEAVVKDGDGAAKAAAKTELNKIADDLVQRYDEFGVLAAPSKEMAEYTRTQVLDRLKKAKDITVRELSDAERSTIKSRSKQAAVRELAGLEKRLEQYGYRLGISPEDKVSTVRTMVVDHHGRERFTEMLMPFSDTLDHVAIDGLDNALVADKLRPTKLTKIWDKLTRPYGVEVTKNNTIERFVSSMVQKTGISVNKARTIMSRITDLAAEKGVQPRALFLNNDEVVKIFREEMGELYGQLELKSTTAIQEIISAAAGDWSVSGLTTGFSGRVKAIFPQMTILTDIIYPEVRFGRLNPFFNLVLERIETAIQMRVYGIRKEVINESIGDIQGTVLRKAHLNPTGVHHEINDGFLKMQERQVQNLATGVEASRSFKGRVSNLVRPLFSRGSYSIKNVKDAKEIARNIMTDKFASREFMDILEEVAPGKIAKLAEHYGVTNADQAVELLLADYLIQSDPLQFAKFIDGNSSFAKSLAAKALKDGGIPAKEAQDIAAATIAAYEIAIKRASRAADQAQYFASHRTWFERSINHPFMGLYPYSYMTQKAIPSLLRIMFVPRYGGVVAPGVGYATWDKAMEWMENKSNSDIDVLKQVLQDDSLVYLFTTLLPVTPDSVGFSMPAWLRRGIIQPGLRGDAIKLGDIGQTMTEVGAQVVRGTVLGQSRTILEGIQGIDDATKANEGINGFLESQADLIQEKVLELRGQ